MTINLVYHHICWFTKLWKERIWNCISLPWYIRKRNKSYLLWMISYHTLGKVERRYRFKEEVHNYKVRATSPFRYFIEETTSKQSEMVHQREGGKILSSPHLIQDFWYQKPPKMGRCDLDHYIFCYPSQCIQSGKNGRIN